jgi:hypothetical protein
MSPPSSGSRNKSRKKPAWKRHRADPEDEGDMFLRNVGWLKRSKLRYMSEDKTFHKHHRDSVVGIVTGYGLDDGGFGVGVPVGLTVFSSPCRTDRLWGSSSLVSNGYCGLFPLGKSGRSMKLTTHLQLVLRRLALSKGPNWVGVFSPTFTWGWKEIQFPKRRVL